MTDQDIQQIDKYLNGELSAKDSATFELRLKQEDNLAKEFKLQREIKAHFQNELVETEHFEESNYSKELRDFYNTDEAKQFKKKIAERHHNFVGNEKQTQPKSRNYLLIAAAITVLIISTLFIFNTQDKNPTQLYVEYYTAEDLPSLVQRGDNQDNLVKGTIAFKEGDFIKAETLLKSYIETTDSPSMNAFLYLGMVKAELGNYDSAMLNFDKVLTSNSLDASKGLWFKALTLLKKADIVEAKEVLKVILKDENNFNYEKAKELLKAL